MTHDDCPTCHQPIYNVQGAIADMVSLKAKLHDYEILFDEITRRMSQDIRMIAHVIAMRNATKD